MTKYDAKKYELLKEAVFSQAQLYAEMYRKQCKLFHRNAALEEEFLQKHAEMMEIIQKAELEVTEELEAKDIKSFIDKLTDEEKKQALALLQGMIIGKELVQQQKEPA